MPRTKDLIVEGSELPLSIIIIGIGNSSFANMIELDADENPIISSTGVQMKRDIVQFVPFNEVQNDPIRLAKEVLTELPGQVCDYFGERGMEPNPPLPPNPTAIFAPVQPTAPPLE